MHVLVINAGSSSLKFQLIDMDGERRLIKGNCDRIGQDRGWLKAEYEDGRKIEREESFDGHADAFKVISALLVDEREGVISRLSDIDAIGHRVAHGGDIYPSSVIIDDEVIAGIESLITLAPLHNKPQLDGILACRDVFGQAIPQCAVFDTSFHSTMPKKAYLYAIPYSYYQKYKIRKYGFHGSSHRFVSYRCAKLMNRDIKDMKIITCHIGNGSSIAAIKNGSVVDTSMGLTPLDGFMMGTRSGSLDPSVVTYLMEKESLSPKDMDEILNRRSGILGISGISSDDREICEAESEGNERAKLAREMQSYQIIKTVGSYISAMNGVDAIVFTAGIGENQPLIRKALCDNLTYLGVMLDDEKNETMVRGGEGTVTTEDSRVAVWVIPTNEELLIARDVRCLAEKLLAVKG